jgi:vancomycin resistance protein YoaR
VETVQVTINLPVSAQLSTYLRALEAARDAQTDPRAKQALAAVTALASRGLVENLARSMNSAGRSDTKLRDTDS